MFDISSAEDGRIVLSGRLDTAQCDKAKAFLDAIEAPEILDFSELDYISSAGLGILLVTQKRVMKAGGALTLVNLNKHISDIFRFSGFDKVFKIETRD